MENENVLLIRAFIFALIILLAAIIYDVKTRKR